MKEQIKEIVQSFLGMKPRDVGCHNWQDMVENMTDEIMEVVGVTVFFNIDNFEIIGESTYDFTEDMYYSDMSYISESATILQYKGKDSQGDPVFIYICGAFAYHTQAMYLWPVKIKKV